ncbi:acyltransferase [Actinomadura kijaniata]|uniref:acyltransferase n=1 Tax=Actinomadura kijaniata TaxID=46161 RepID=UPI0008359001|nr:acyltransferase [Actinomadura kijaniata]
MTEFIHSTAIVESGARLGAGTRVWHQAHVRAGASIGENCVLGKNVFVDSGVRIGSGVKIQNNVSVYRGVDIADDVFVGPSAVFTNDLRPRAFSQDWTVTPTYVRRGASIGANATIVCGVEIDEYALVAAGAVVTRSVPAHQLVAGNPARPLGWVCRCARTVARTPDPPADLVCADCRADGA